jgi:hypothetical protein
MHTVTHSTTDAIPALLEITLLQLQLATNTDTHNETRYHNIVTLQHTHTHHYILLHVTCYLCSKPLLCTVYSDKPPHHMNTFIAYCILHAALRLPI